MHLYPYSISSHR